jgi:hypothetical protein
LQRNCEAEEQKQKNRDCISGVLVVVVVVHSVLWCITISAFIGKHIRCIIYTDPAFTLLTNSLLLFAAKQYDYLVSIKYMLVQKPFDMVMVVFNEASSHSNLLTWSQLFINRKEDYRIGLAKVLQF